ncbi:MAG: F0F1 ATP synthase subunit alpha, partial [Pseudomonadota bacterium]
FGSDLDASTQKLLNRGARLTELLKQKQFSPMPFEEQTISIFAGTNGYIDSIEVARVGEYEEQMLAFFRTSHADVLSDIRETKKFDGDIKDRTVAALDTFAKQFA